MKTAFETRTAELPVLRPTATAPSLRVPVTIGNREKLRRLRAAEMLAWEAADHQASLRNSMQSSVQQH